MKYITLLFASIFCFTAARSQVVVTVAGTDTPGYAGDGGPATNAKMINPYALAFDKDGNLYFSDQAHSSVRKVTPGGIVSRFAGTGTPGFCCDGSAAYAAQTNFISGICVDKTGNVFLCDGGNNRIRKVTTDGIIHTIAGNGTAGYNGDGIPATDAQLNGPMSVAVDDTGNLYISDRENYRIRKVSTLGIITTIAGTGVAGYSADGSMADTSKIDISSCMTMDTANNIIFNDKFRIRKIDKSSGLLTTFAGNGVNGFTGDDGPATNASISTVKFIVDSVGNIFMGEQTYNRIRKVSTTGIITTITGTGFGAYNGEGVSIASANIGSPCGVAISPEGELFFATLSNARIRKITAFWSTIGDSPSPGDSVRVFPNPATDEVYIEVLTKEPELTMVTVLDASGKPVFEKQIETNVLQSIKSDWPVGSYTIRVSCGQKTMSKQIIIANK